MLMRVVMMMRVKMVLVMVVMMNDEAVDNKGCINETRI